MKESITKFDLEAAFKALDDIEIPVAEKGIRANKPALTEIFSKKSKLDVLMEEYYDINNTGELEDAKEDREAEVAKAKLARIEKIVDLDAESPDDLLTSYVGKFIIQCPQCMTLFYKNPEDVENSEEDDTIVNVNEVCQHCGNESGYTLIGKVGAAEAEDTFEDDFVEAEDSTEDAEEVTYEGDETAEESEEDFDLGDDLEDIDLEIEDDELDDTKEEALSTPSSAPLTEDIDLEVSAEEFENLINSSEFKKPISDSAARAMLNSEEEKEEIKETLTETKEKQVELKTLIIGDKFSINGFKYEVVRVDGDREDYTVKSYGKRNPEDDVNTAGYILMRGSDKVIEILEDDKLEEGGLGTLGNALKKKIGNAGKSLKDKLSKAIDKFADNANTREEKADFILNCAITPGAEVTLDEKGNINLTDDNKRFGAFLIIGFTNKYSNGKLITLPPSPSNTDLVVGNIAGSKQKITKETFKDAENLAKGWSQKDGNGPAFILLVKTEDDKNGVFLCEYFNGEPANDNINKYFDKIKKDLEGSKLMASAGVDPNESSSTEVPSTNEPQEESLATVVNSMDDLHEESLEKGISGALTEICGNVADFKITDCEYLNEQLLITGDISFKVGTPEKTTYVFTEAFIDNNKIRLQGTNSRFDLNEKFNIIGYIEQENKTFITESFK